MQNQFGQPVGFAMADWTPRERPTRSVLSGRFCRLEPLDPAQHAQALYTLLSSEPDARLWTYLPYGPFMTYEDFAEWIKAASQSIDPLFFAILDAATGQPVGICSYLRIDPVNGSIEVGHLIYTALLRKTIAATEAMFLMMQNAFQLGYRRYEWKCDSLNGPSRAAATRLGFQFEGIFRQAVVYKQRNRDTAWHSIIDTDWPRLQTAFLSWLAPANFGARGQQQVRLADLTRLPLA